DDPPPGRRKNDSTHHPPIYPTQALHPNALDGPKARVYELVVRRFLATFSPPMITESTRADIEAGSESYFVRGSVVIDPGYAAIYTYARPADEEIPKLEEEKREDLAKQIWSGMDEDKFLGPCKVCEEAGRKHEDGSPNRLRIIELKGGKRMYGCEGWDRDNPDSPDSCPVSGPLPGRGYDLWRLEECCSICGE